MDRREAVAEDLRALADDLKSLLESAMTDPKERKRRQRRWSMLEGAIGLMVSIAARRAAIKLWGILTGEQAPVPRPGSPQPPARTEQPQAETISSSSSSVK